MTVHFILAGGGDPKDSRLVDRFYHKLLPKKQLLYLPQAVAPETWTYKHAYNWLRRNKELHDVKIRMWRNLTHKSYKDLEGFDSIYLMGGNTFLLLYHLRKSGFINNLSRFINSGRIVYGISAGAIILGKNILTALIGDEADENRVGLRNLHGLNLLNGYNVHPHYDPKNDHELFAHLEKTKIPFVAITEKSGIYVKNRTMLALGRDPIYAFKNQMVKKSIIPGTKFILS